MKKHPACHSIVRLYGVFSSRTIGPEENCLSTQTLTQTLALTGGDFFLKLLSGHCSIHQRDENLKAVMFLKS